MGDFFTDSEDEKAVEEVLSRAMDSSLLEQISAINCASFTDHGLPSHLETRFQKLKSFPSSAAEFSKSNEAKNSCSVDEKEATRCLTKSPEAKSDSGPFKKSPQRRKLTESLSFSSFEGFSCSSRSVSPPAKIGCFLCSPKKVSSKKKKDESFSQRKMIKKAMQEEEKICREAEKIVKWAKQASARMDVEDVLSDEDYH